MLIQKGIVGGISLLLAVVVPQTAHASVTTTVICDPHTKKCTVVAEAPGHSGSSSSEPSRQSRSSSGSTGYSAPSHDYSPPAASSYDPPAAESSQPAVITGVGGTGVAAPPPAPHVTFNTEGDVRPTCPSGDCVDVPYRLGSIPAYQPPDKTVRRPAQDTPAPPAKPKGKKPPPPPTPAEVAAFAIAILNLPNPQIGTAPCTDAGCMGAVGVPVWLWTQPWPTPTATAAIRGVSITATARITKVTWSMGDGHTVTCTKPGTPFDRSWGFRDSPDCGYRYTHTSANQPGMRYPVTATATWRVTWDGDETGATTTTTIARTRLAIGEYQTVITG